MDAAGGAGRGRGRVVAGSLVALHVGGIAATSHLLERAARWLPGFEASRLAAGLARAGALAPTATDGAVEWAGLVLREALLPAAWEELLFRGVLYAGLNRVAGPRAAILGSALLFGVAHGDLHHGIVATLLGIPLGCLRARHGLAAAWIAHTANNVLAFSGPAGPAARLLFEGGGLLGGALALALAGSSNAILLQALRRGANGDSSRRAAASGDGSV